MTRTAWLCAFLVMLPITALTLMACSSTSAFPEPAVSPWVDAQGQISLPVGFRAGWAHLGSWSVAGPDGEVTLHDVYTEPESASHFAEHGGFPDGATIVKEVRRTRAETLTTGRARSATEPVVWFVMVKDTVGRFPESPAWGDGWGWALFEAQDPQTAVPGDYTQQCLECHVPARDTDWVYVEGYPGLRTAASVAVEPTPPERAPDLPGDGPVVTIRDLAFDPAEIRIARGQTITWVNRDDVLHTATGEDEFFDTGLLMPGRRGQVTFDRAGTFAYSCTPHPFMKATVIVAE